MKENLELKDEETGNTYWFKSEEKKKKAEENGFIKEGTPIANFFNWSFPVITSLELPSRLCPIQRDPNLNGEGVVIDGADETAIALESSGLPKYLIHALQFAIYSAFSSVIYLGYKGAEAEGNEHKRELEKLEKEEKELCKWLKDNIVLGKELIAKYDKSDDSNISNTVIEHLKTTGDFYDTMLSSLRNNQGDPKKFAEIIEKISEWKQVNDKLFLERVQAHICSSASLSALSWMWWAMISFASVSSINMLQSLGTSTSAFEPIKEILEIAGNGFISAGQIMMVIYGLIETAEGINEVHTLNEWIYKIKTSTIIDTKTKDLIISHLQSKRTHEFIAKVIGSFMLTAGQIMMLVSGLGLASSLVLPGAALTIFGIAITIITNYFKDKKFKIIEESSKEETDIIGNNADLKGYSEKEYKEFLNSKIKKLKELSDSKIEQLCIIDACSEIIEYANKNSSNPEAEYILQKVLKKYSNIMYFDNINSKYQEIQLKLKISKLIDVFYKNKPEFFNIVCSNVLNKHISPGSTLAVIINELKTTSYWKAIEGSLLDTLIIDKKAMNNIRGKRFERYIEKDTVTQTRMLGIPGILPLVNCLEPCLPSIAKFLDKYLNFKFKMPLLSSKIKTVYYFNSEKFIEDLNSKSNDSIFEEVKIVLQDKIEQVLVEHGKLKLKSDVYRPLWVELPQLVCQERVFNDFNTTVMLQRAPNKQQPVLNTVSTLN